TTAFSWPRRWHAPATALAPSPSCAPRSRRGSRRAATTAMRTPPTSRTRRAASRGSKSTPTRIPAGTTTAAEKDATMDLELNDTERMLRDTFRDFFTREIEPHVPAMERGELLPYDLMRHMHRTLGLDAMLPAMRGGTSAPSDAMDANVARYARTTFMVEMARVSPGFALSYGASVGLFAGKL